MHTPHDIAYTGKGTAKGARGAGIAGVKRGAEALFQKDKDWEVATEASEPALSEASAFPATTEASVRCKSVCLLAVRLP